MAKTSTEVCTEALRMIGVVANDVEIEAEDLARCQAHMADIFSTLNDTEGLAFEWTIETVPDGAFLAFARAVAGSVASSYSVANAAAEAAMVINPRKTLYRIGMDGLREFAAPDMNHENNVVWANYF